MTDFHAREAVRPWSIGGVNQFRGVSINTVPDYGNYVAGGPSCKHVMWAPTQQEAERIIADHNAAVAKTTGGVS